MLYQRTFCELEVRAKLVLQRLRVVAAGGESAAWFGAIGAEGCYDDVASDFEGCGDLAHVGGPLFGLGEEVEDGSIVPDVVDAWGKGDFGYVSGEPVDLFCGWP